MYAFILGSSAQRIRQEVITSTDVKAIQAFANLNEFVAVATRQNLRFERLIFTAQIVTSEQELRSVREYLVNNGLSTQIVLLVRDWESSDGQINDVYYDVFTSPIYTDYTLSHGESIDVELFKFLCTGSLDKIRSEHSSVKNSIPKVKHQVQPTGVSDAEPAQKKMPNCTFKDGLIKTFTFGGKVFGRGKLTKKELAKFKPLWSQANAVLK